MCIYYYRGKEYTNHLEKEGKYKTIDFLSQWKLAQMMLCVVCCWVLSCRYRIFHHWNRSQPLPTETRMRSLKFHSSTGKSKQRTLSCDSHVTGTSLPPVQLPNKTQVSFDLQWCNDYVIVKTQGPFHHPGMVWRQRHRPLNPTLRVATPFNSEEIARSHKHCRERERERERECISYFRVLVTLILVKPSEKGPSW